MKQRKPGVSGPDGEVLGANTEIARRLREYYADVVAQDVPERFVELLSRLEEAAAARKDRSTGKED